MQTLAHFGAGGPGPWILLFPPDPGSGHRRRHRTAAPHGTAGMPWPGPGRPAVADDSPVKVSGHRFASGEIGEDEYGRRLSVLDEEFGRRGKGGAA